MPSAHSTCHRPVTSCTDGFNGAQELQTASASTLASACQRCRLQGGPVRVLIVFNRIDEVAPNAMAFRYMTADLAPQIVGLLAVNVSWDSGHLTPSAEQRRAGWNRVGEFPVSAVVDLPRAHSWPTSYCQNGRFDEWRFRSRTATPTAPARTGHRSRRIGVRHRERVRSCWRA